MTTNIGIESKLDEKNPAVVLASDLTVTRQEYVDKGDFVIRNTTKGETQKIHIATSGDFAIAIAGTVDEPLFDFLYNMLNGKHDIQKAIKKGDYPEIRNLNAYRWQGRMPNNNITSLIIASRFDNKPAFYTAWPLGLIEPRIWTAIGSGSDYALKHIANSGFPRPPNKSISESIQLANDALMAASEDMYTGGLDLVVVKKDGIDTYGSLVKKKIDRAKRNVINQIKSKYR